MKIFAGLCAFFALLLLVCSPSFAHAPKAMLVSSAPALSNTAILLIRHAEKPDEGDGLTPAGQQRAQEYVGYFQHYMLNGHTVHIDALYAARDSKGSMRPRLTITPLSQALGLPINQPYKDKQPDELANLLRSNAAGKTIVICWHHGEIPDLLAALGADPNALLPGGDWPGHQFGWVIQLCYDREGRLIPSLTKRVDEHLPAH